MNRFERLQKEIIDTTEHYQELMGLGNFTIRHTFDTTQLSEVLAECEPMWEYHSADIRWYLKGHEDMDVPNTAVHELTHVLLAPLQDFVPKKHHKLSEWVTEAVTKAILRAEDL